MRRGLHRKWSAGGLAGLATVEHRTDRADVLVVSSGWPNPENPTYCIFVKRQMDALEARGIRYETLFIRGYRSPLAYPLAAFRILIWNLTRPGYRLVHSHGGEAALIARFYVRAPVLCSYLGLDVLGKSLRKDGKLTVVKRLRRWCINQHARLATETITKSREMQDALPAPVHPRNHIVPNGVDTTVFHPQDRDAARVKLGWDPDARIVLFVGDPGELRKRYELSEQAVEAADAELGNVQLKLAYMVTPDDVATYMNAADALIHPSWSEGSPNAVKEALMCNLPVVATPVGDVRDLLRDVEPSYLVEPTIDSIRDALVACLQTPRRSNGFERSTHLTADKVAERVLNIYEGLLADR